MTVVVTFPPSTDKKWYEIWWSVWTKPGITHFQEVLNNNDTQLERSFMWTATSSGISAAIGLLLALILDVYSINFGTLLIALVVTPIGAVISLAISAGFYHLLAKLFGGNGQ